MAYLLGENAVEIGVLPWVLCAVVTGVVARIRRHNVYLWSLIGFVAGPLGLILIFAFPPGADGNSGKVGVITIGLTTRVLETLPSLCQIYHCFSNGLSILRTGHTQCFSREENRRKRVMLKLPPRLHL